MVALALALALALTWALKFRHYRASFGSPRSLIWIPFAHTGIPSPSLTTCWWKITPTLSAPLLDGCLNHIQTLKSSFWLHHLSPYLQGITSSKKGLTEAAGYMHFHYLKNTKLFGLAPYNSHSFFVFNAHHICWVFEHLDHGLCSLIMGQLSALLFAYF